jgi:hypothetical protein
MIPTLHLAAAMLEVLVVVASARWMLGRRTVSVWYRLVVTTILAIALAGGWMLAVRVPRFPPVEDFDRILLGVLPLAWMLDVFAPRFGAAAWLLRCLVAAGAVRLVVHGSQYVATGQKDAWTTAQSVVHCAGWAIALVVSWWLSALLEVRRPNFRSAWVVWPAAATSAVAVTLSGYLSCGLALLLLACAGLAVALTYRTPNAILRNTSNDAVLWILWMSWLAAAVYFSDMSVYVAISLLAIPSTPWLVAVVRFPKNYARIQTALIYSVPIALCGAILITYLLPLAGVQARTPATSAQPNYQDYLQFGK